MKIPFLSIQSNGTSQEDSLIEASTKQRLQFEHTVQSHRNTCHFVSVINYNRLSYIPFVYRSPMKRERDHMTTRRHTHGPY